ncbi:hypothetical protein LWI28_005875 [Acer negundo]|uniref:Uncharacterized protein n=1 Tax=Acer negundo TaxID=4023 RepID=A0AAD5JRU8_ACENE|nr:hypothetical protein LWI28_005875 [Acer negundo]
MCTSIDPCSVPAKSKMRSLPSRSVGTSLVRTCALGTYCNLLVLSLRFEREYFIGADQHIEHFWENVSSRSVCHYTETQQPISISTHSIFKLASLSQILEISDFVL